jgi:hypothetical protein
MRKRNRHRAFSYRRSASLHRSVTDIRGGEHAGLLVFRIRCERQRLIATAPL